MLTGGTIWLSTHGHVWEPGVVCKHDGHLRLAVRSHGRWTGAKVAAGRRPRRAPRDCDLAAIGQLDGSSFSQGASILVVLKGYRKENHKLGGPCGHEVLVPDKAMLYPARGAARQAVEPNLALRP